MSKKSRESGRTDGKLKLVRVHGVSTFKFDDRLNLLRFVFVPREHSPGKTAMTVPRRGRARDL